MDLILASASPARADLLRAAGYRFAQRPSGFKEPPRRLSQSFQAWLGGLARQKALTVARRYPRCFVLGADTAIYFNHRVIGKAGDRAAAVRLLTQLAGRTHAISTALCVVAPGGRHYWTGRSTARVTLRAWSKPELRHYVNTLKTTGYAGAYALQGGGAAIIARIAGDPTTVVGLPMHLLAQLLRQSGYRRAARLTKWADSRRPAHSG